jgi:hypothetical protein
MMNKRMLLETSMNHPVLTVLALVMALLLLPAALAWLFPDKKEAVAAHNAEAVYAAYDDLVAYMRNVIEKQRGTILRYKERERHLYEVLYTLLWMSQTGYPNKAATIVEMFISYQETIVEAVKIWNESGGKRFKEAHNA